MNEQPKSPSIASSPQQQSAVKTWAQALRLFSFTACLVPVGVGTTLAYLEGCFDGTLFLAVLLGSVLIQAGTNLVNDYYDFQSGVDRLEDEELHLAGPSMVIQRGLLKPRSVLWAGILCFVLGAGIGFYLVGRCGPALLVPGLLSVAAGFFYTARPVSLAYLPLGEITVFVFMGPMIVWGAHFVQTGRWDWLPIVVSLPVALLVTAILHANNLRDLHRDKERGKRTLATIVGAKAAAWELACLLFGSYLATVAFIHYGLLPTTTALVLLTLPEAVAITRAAFMSPHGTQGNESVLRTAQLHSKFGVLLILGLLLARFL